MLISVIVTTYERPDALDHVLGALARQDDRRFEVLVADDGSGSETARVVERWQGRVGSRLEHVWQANEGFRAARCRNAAVVAAHGDYVTFLDGDCIPRASFVAMHRSFAEAGWFATGNRILCSQGLTERLLREHPPAQLPDRLWSALRARWSRDINRVMPLIDLPGAPSSLRRLRGSDWRGAKACNFGVWRADFEAVDGFDERFEGWGYEDSDLVARLIHRGVRRKDVRFATAVFHLWHRHEDRADSTRNREYLEETLRLGRDRAIRGLSLVHASR